MTEAPNASPETLGVSVEAMRDLILKHGFSRDMQRVTPREAVTAAQAIHNLVYPAPADKSQTDMGERVAELEACIASAFEAGAMSVHQYWTENPGEAPRGDPEFSEAASDYADTIDVAALLNPKLEG